MNVNVLYLRLHLTVHVKLVPSPYRLVPMRLNGLSCQASGLWAGKIDAEQIVFEISVPMEHQSEWLRLTAWIPVEIRKD